MNEFDWNYEEVDDGFAPIPAGDYRCRIEDATVKISKAGNDMIELVITISGKNSRIWEYIVFRPDLKDITNRKLTRIYDAFGIEKGNRNVSTWCGKTATCRTKVDEDGYAKISYFHRKKDAERLNLPAWEEPTSKYEAKFENSGFEILSDDEVPF
jgi:hypothetical protein